MQVLTAAAIGALFKMIFIVAPHGRGDAGDVVTPTGQDVTNHRIDTAILACIAW
jgi:hypothetical protein